MKKLLNAFKKSRNFITHDYLVFTLYDIAMLLILLILITVSFFPIYFAAEKLDMKGHAMQVYTSYIQKNLMGSEEDRAKLMEVSAGASKSVMFFILSCFITVLFAFSLFIAGYSYFSSKIWFRLRRIKSDFRNFFKSMLCKNLIAGWIFILLIIILSWLLFREQIGANRIMAIDLIIVAYAVYFFQVSNIYLNPSKKIIYNLNNTLKISSKRLHMAIVLLIIFLAVFIIITLLLSYSTYLIPAKLAALIFFIILLFVLNWSRLMFYYYLSSYLKLRSRRKHA